MSQVIEPPPLAGSHHEAWVALLEIAQRLPTAWTLAGGQMVMLHCWERGHSPGRPTIDGDVVLDVRADSMMLRRFTQTLTDIGFTSAGASPGGHEHRWLRGGAQIDVLIPENVGERAAARIGTTGRPTVQTPGGIDALEHTRCVQVRIGGLKAAVPRPHLAGALLAKGRAYGLRVDPGRERHLADAAISASMLNRQDNCDMETLLATPRMRQGLVSLLKSLRANPQAWEAIDGADAGVERLGIVLNA